MQALAVLDLDVFQQFPFGLGPVEATAQLQLAQQRIVAVESAHVVNQTLVEAEHGEQVLVLHRRIEALFQVVVDAVDNPQVFVEVCDGIAQDAQNERIQAVDFRELALVHHGHFAVRKEQHPVLEDEDAEGFHAELEVVLGGIVLRLLEHDGRKVVVVLDTGKLVGVECGGYSMLGNLVFFD